MKCRRCDCETPRTAAGQKYCPPCAREVHLATKRDHEDRKRREQGAAVVGAPGLCGHCGASFIRTSPARKYCEPCSVQRRADQARVAKAKYAAKAPPRKRNSEKDKARQRKWAEENRERTRQRTNAERAAKREAFNASRRAYNKTATRRAYVVEWERKRRAEDPVFVLNTRMRQAVRRHFKHGKDGRSWRDLVGYSSDELRAHLERQFVKGMDWNNIGEWHVDHILPLSSFDYQSPADPDFRAAWALANLRPLWGVDNSRKGAKRLTLL